MLLVLVVEPDLEADVGKDTDKGRADDTLHPGHIYEGANEHRDALSKSHSELHPEEWGHLALVVDPLECGHHC